MRTSTCNIAPRAVVLGASMAGLLTARVLADHFDEVVLIERDPLPDGPAPRRGTPHAVHPHGLLARGLDEIERLFPGFTDAMVLQGGILGDMQSDVGFDAGRRRFASPPAGRLALLASRLAIEAQLRRRVRAMPRVRLETGVIALEPRHDAGRVVAARYVPADGTPALPIELPCSLLVDATGRASKLPSWLRAWGHAAPPEDRVAIGICYVSAWFRRDGAAALGPGLDKVATFGAVTPAQPRPGVLLAQEPGADGVARWVAGVGGYVGDHPEATLEGLRRRAADIGAPELRRVTHTAEPIGDVLRYTMPYSLRRRYERLHHFPEGLLAIGDALTSFNPIYGQGMTVAACEARVLAHELARGPNALDGLARRCFRRFAAVIDTPWQLAVGGDLALPAVPGRRPWPVRLVNAYLARLFEVAPLDDAVSAAFQRVVHMLASPASLFAPGIVWRVWRGSGRAAGRRRAPAHAGAALTRPR